MSDFNRTSEKRPSARRGRIERKITCNVCGDTHKMWMQRIERFVLCTHCPVPCARCRRGAYCKTTPCNCDCHAKEMLS